MNRGSWGRGRARGQPDRPGPGMPGETPVSAHTRASGFRDFIALDQQRRIDRRQQHLQNTTEDERQDEEGAEEQIIRDRLTEEECRGLKLENEQHRKDVIYYFTKRVTLYLIDSPEGEDLIKPGLSLSSLSALRKVLEIIGRHHQAADENFSILRRSAWFHEEDVEEHEVWYNGLTDALTSLFDQLSDMERNLNVTLGPDPHSTTLPPEPVHSSERYTPPVVEPIKLDTFSGIDGTYRTFKTRFNLVMKKSKIDDALQAEYLLKAVILEPLRIVMLVDLEHPNAIKLMWEHLDRRYGNEQCDYQHHVTELQKLATYPACRTPSDLKELYYTFTEHIYAMRRISKNEETGEDYKTTLCRLLPDYMKRKMYKLMQERPQEYTLNRMMTMVEQQVRLSNMEIAASGGEAGGREGGRSSGYQREQGNPWAKSRVEAERRAKACTGRLSDAHYMEPFMDDQPLQDRSKTSSVNTVTVGHDTFSVPGPVARTCYPVNRARIIPRPPLENHYNFGAGDSSNRGHTQSQGSHFNFGVDVSSCSVPPVTSYMETLTNGMAECNMESPSFQVNAAKVPKGTSTGVSSTAGNSTPNWGNQTVSLRVRTSACVFCNGDHGSLECRAFRLPNQYMEVLNKQNRCFNCFSQDHSSLFCTVDSTCKAPGCNVTARHCHFYCGRFRTQAKNTYSGVVACSVDAAGNFEDSRLHTVQFLLVNPETGVEVLVRGFLDGGCTDTFLLESMAQKIALSGMDSRVNFLLKLFGDHRVREDGALVKAIFKSVDGSYVSPLITCITKGALIEDVDSYGLSAEQRTFIQRGRYMISDESATVDGKLPIDVVFGQDLYYQMVRGAPIHCPDGLVLLDTVFGYTLGGPVKTRMPPARVHANYLRCRLPAGTKKFIDLDHLSTGVPHRHAVPESCIPLDDQLCKGEGEF